MNGTYNIDLEKLNKSVETISGIEDCISSRDLSEGFTNLENYFRDLNFEHGNFLNYKEDLELIFSNIDKIKRKISNLVDALITTTENFGDIETLNSKDIKELTSIYKNTPSSEKIGGLINNKFRRALASDLYENNQYQNTQNGNVTTIPKVEEPLEEYTTEGINTVPIGIAIGATGIVGSIGAVIVNEKYGRKTKKKELPTVDDDEALFASSEKGNDNFFQNDEDNLDNYETPYKASRSQRESDKYYGNEIILDEDDSSDENNGKYYE